MDFAEGSISGGLCPTHPRIVPAPPQLVVIVPDLVFLAPEVPALPSASGHLLLGDTVHLLFTVRPPLTLRCKDYSCPVG